MKTIVLSLGGSLIIPEQYDLSFLKNFRGLVLRLASKGYRFVIFTGGGKLARNFQEALKNYKKDASMRSLDWVGIYATRINAHVVRRMFGENAEKEIITNPTKKIRAKKKVIIAAGWKPGWSTDYDSVLVAKQLKAKKVINVTNVDYAYDKDPKKYKDAKKIRNILWKDFRKITGSKWNPGLNMPFDPIASKMAEKLKMEVFLVGKNLKNLENAIIGKKFNGTVIRS